MRSIFDPTSLLPCSHSFTQKSSRNTHIKKHGAGTLERLTAEETAQKIGTPLKRAPSTGSRAADTSSENSSAPESEAEETTVAQSEHCSSHVKAEV